MNDVAYPPPPWRTHGNGAFASYLVRRRDLALPSGFDAMTVMGRALGLLAYIEYQPPSPLSYNELIWMPAMVRARRRDGAPWRGYYVSAMYVDNEAALVAGRREWALPKIRARFETKGARIVVSAEDGTEVELRRRAFGPAIHSESGIATVQRGERGLVRFRCSFVGSLRMGRLELGRMSPGREPWLAFASARPVPGLPHAVLESFQATMHPPIRE
jgi:hypothetical protein